MATVFVCDKCKKHSPDDERLFIANGWTRFSYTPKGTIFTRELLLLLCDDCTDNLLNWIKGIDSQIKA